MASTSLNDLASRIMEYQQRVQRLDDVFRGWTGGGGTVFNPESITSIHGEFVVPPLDSMRVDRVSSQSVPGETDTIIQFDTIIFNNGYWAYSTSDSSAFISHPAPPTFQSEVVVGWVAFEAQDDGFRRLALRATTNLAQIIPLASANTVVGSPIIIPFSYPRRMTSSASAIRLTAYQNGTLGNIGVTASLGIVKIGRR